MIADVNECLEFPCSLHFVCNNTVGSYTCYCDEGFALVGDKCEGITNITLKSIIKNEGSFHIYTCNHDE